MNIYAFVEWVGRKILPAITNSTFVYFAMQYSRHPAGDFSTDEPVFSIILAKVSVAADKKNVKVFLFPRL